LVHPNPGVADVRRVALSAHSGGVKGLQFAVKTNPARDLDAVWLMDVSRFNYALPPDPTNEDKDKRWASLWSWAASAERKYSLVTWGYSFTKGDAKALSATLKGEMQPADDAFWNLWETAPAGAVKPTRCVGKGGEPWWQEVCKDVLAEDELSLDKEHGLVSTHQFAFFGGRTLNAELRKRETWIEIFLRGVDRLDP